MPKKASATNPGYTTLWAVVMPYSKDEPRYEDSKAWVRVFSVKETAEEVLKTIKPLTLIQGTGEAYIVDAELIDYTLPEELKPVKNADSRLRALSFILFPGFTTPRPERSWWTVLMSVTGSSGNSGTGRGWHFRSPRYLQCRFGTISGPDIPKPRMRK